MRSFLVATLVLALVAGSTQAGVIKLLTQDTWEDNPPSPVGLPDDGFINWAQNTLGHTVIKQVVSADLDPDVLKAECDADGTQLIVIGPRNTSGNYDVKRAVWNAMPIPILCLVPHALQLTNNRLGWFGQGVSGADKQAWEDMSFDLPAHPWVSGLGTQFYDYPTSVGDTRWYDLQAAYTGTGTIIAHRDASANGVGIVSWDEGDVLGDGTAAGEARVFFAGTDWARYVSGYQCSFDNYTADGKESLQRVISSIIPEPTTLALLGLGVLASLIRRKK